MTSKVAFRGGYTCSCVAESLPLVEEEMLLRGLISDSIDIFQLGWRNDVGASAGTHSRGGCTDVAQFSDAQIEIWRLWGWTMQHRTPTQGFSHHAHGWPWGCTHLASSAQSQATQWRNRQNGLVSRGRVQGRWPIDTWTTARDKRRKVVMALKDDIANEVVAKMKGQYDDIAKAVLTTDGLIPNSMTGNPDNKFIALNSGVEFTGRKLNELNNSSVSVVKAVTQLTATQKTQATQLAAIQKQLADLAALVAKGPQA